MPALAALLAVTLSALPFPAPRLAPVTDKTKCDAGTVLSLDGARSELRVTTAAGIVTFRAGPDVQVFDREGKPAGSAARLAPGAHVRVYFVVEDGARALEIDEE